MLYQYIRLFKSVNGTLSDYSLQNQDESTNVLFDLTTGQDYFYLAQHFPFNNFYIQLAVANDVAAVMSIDYWDGNAWRAAVDVLDGTSTGGVSMAKSGVVQFSPSDSYRWDYIPDTSDNTAPDELDDITIYNLYWLRIKFNATLKNTTAAKRLVYAFSTHQQIDNYDTTINDYLTTFSASKTSWDDEIITASMQVVGDLKRMQIIRNRGQLLRFDDVSQATDWKTLIHIYRNLGGDYKSKYDIAVTEYEKALDQKFFTIDLNDDGMADVNEVTNTNYRLARV